MEREEVYKFIETVRQIKAAQADHVPLSEYFPREIADALQSLINSAIDREREQCAIVAESAAEPSGAIARGQHFDADPTKKRVCLEVAELIRRRGAR